MASRTQIEVISPEIVELLTRKNKSEYGMSMEDVAVISGAAINKLFLF